jgi:hypothetical protein
MREKGEKEGKKREAYGGLLEVSEKAYLSSIPEES